MTKFLNKKEQVYDLKLTSYGRYLFSIGSFKPTYYAFFDDNITYDSRYMASFSPAVLASATVTVDDVSDMSADDTVQIITTDDTTITATVTAHGGTTTTTDTDSPTFAIVNGSTTNTATNLATCLDANSRLSATSSGAVVTVTQAVGGEAGNTVITITDSGDDGLSKTDFTGGAGQNGIEGQNNVNKRIKQDTPYLEGLVLFRDVDEYVSRNTGEVLSALGIYGAGNFTPTMVEPDADIFKYNSMIGDAYLDGKTNRNL